MDPGAEAHTPKSGTSSKIIQTTGSGHRSPSSLSSLPTAASLLAFGHGIAFGVGPSQSRKSGFESFAPDSAFIDRMEIIVVAFASTVYEWATNGEDRIVVESLLGVGTWTGFFR